MNVLLTGGTGYLGSHLARACIAQGHQVAILKRSYSSLDRLQGVLRDVAVFDLDLGGMDEAFRVHQFDAVVHTATCYGRKGEHLREMMQSNVAFPLELLERAIGAGVTCFVNTDTSLDKQLNAYALSKKHFVEWGRYVAVQGKLRFVNLVLEHFYGPGDDRSKFVSFVIRQCLDRAAQIDLTAGDQRRDFIYIDDVVGAYLLVLKEADRLDGSWLEFALGSGEDVSIRQLVELIRHLTNAKTRLNFGALPYRAGEQMHSCADIRPLRRLGWSPKISLQAGLEQVIAEERRR